MSLLKSGLLNSKDYYKTKETNITCMLNQSGTISSALSVVQPVTALAIGVVFLIHPLCYIPKFEIKLHMKHN